MEQKVMVVIFYKTGSLAAGVAFVVQ